MLPFVCRLAKDCTAYCSCAQATSYLNKLPDKLAADDRILVVDPMLATGKPRGCSAISALMPAVDSHRCSDKHDMCKNTCSKMLWIIVL